MTRYIPTPTEQTAIDELRLAGYVVLRARSYNARTEQLRRAECVAEMEIERRESAERWAHRCLADERRLSARLDQVCTAAAALGVPIDAINAALREEVGRGVQEQASQD